MKCLECATDEMKACKENFKYPCSVDVILIDIQVYRCKECGSFEVDIPNVERLHDVIAKAILRRSGAALKGGEVRFLRKYLGWSGKDFATRMEVTPETVSKWENNKRNMSRMAAQLLKMYVVIGPQPLQYDATADRWASDDLETLGERVSTWMSLSLSPSQKLLMPRDVTCSTRLHHSASRGWETGCSAA